jgi:hypothetical protein
VALGFPEHALLEEDPLNAVDLIEKAGNLVGGDRAKQHGDKHRNFATIASLWSAYLQSKNGAPITATDVGYMMALLKIARAQSGAINDDDAIDAIGYIACAGEIATTKR